MILAILNWRDEGHPEAGGAELFCHQVAAQLAAAGHQVTYVTARHPGAPARSEHPGGYSVVRSGGRFTVYPRALWWLLRHAGKLDGVVDSQNGIPFFSPLAVRRQTPVVLLMHHVHQEQFALYFPPPVAAVGRWLESSVARFVYGRRAVAAVSPSTRSATRRQLRLRGTIRLTPCGLAPATTHSRTRSSEPTVVTVGRLVPHKQMHLLVAALPDVIAARGPVTIHIIGDGSELPRLRELALRLGVGEQVLFHGRVSDLRRDELLSGAWLTVNPTVGEGWGLSVLEANRIGVPALAFTVDGLRDSVVDGVTGWLVPPGEQLGPRIAEALHALTDEATAAEYESASRAWASAFTWDATAAGLLKLLAEERERLRHPADRRLRSDLVTVVDVAAEHLPPRWNPRLRLGDAVVREASRVRILLYAAGHSEIVPLLRRNGVDEEVIRKGLYEVSVAGQQDSLLLAAGSPGSTLNRVAHPAVGEHPNVSA